MATWKCNSCGATYSDTQRDGTAYFHACPAETITHSVFSLLGVLVTPESRAPMANARDENIPRGLTYIEGKPFIVTRDPTDATREIRTPAVSLVIAEGAGRTLVAP